MTPWTGHPGSPTPEPLRHALVPCGERQRRCTRCEGYWWLDELPKEGDLCPVAVSQRLAELEAHEASLHKYGAWLRGEIVRWLRRDLDRLWTAMQNKRITDLRAMQLQGRREALAKAANAIARGEYVAWCEAHPVSPAPVGADAGRDPGSSEE